MSLTLKTIENLSQEIAFFRYKKMKSGDILITNDIGKYSFLTSGDFEKFISGELTGPKKDELTEKLFYKTPDYEEKLAALYLEKNKFLYYGPTLHMIVTTLRCNHKCEYCHAAVAPMTAKGLDMTLETAKNVVDTIFFSSSPSITIEFQGGESLVNWEVVQFITEYARQKAESLSKQLFLSIVSNLTLMSEEKLKWLLDHKVEICTSLDGDKLVHNAQRVWKEGDSFDTVSYWIKRINEEIKYRGAPESFSIGALATWTKTSIKQYKEIIDTYVSLGLRSIGFRWLNPYGFATVERERMEFTPTEFLDFFQKGLDYVIEINKSGYKLREMITSVYLSKIFFNADGNFMDIRSPSGVAVGGVAYNYDGKVYAGDEARMLGRMGIEDFLLTPMLATGDQTMKAMAQSTVTRAALESSVIDGLPGYNDHVYKPYIGVDILYNFTQYGTIFSNFSKDEKNKMQIIMLDYIFEKLQDPENEKVFRSWF
ncbi:MAG: hypothetical protein HHAS10_09820 [Candidatus Altimarinota bacterium]